MTDMLEFMDVARSRQYICDTDGMIRQHIKHICATYNIQTVKVDFDTSVKHFRLMRRLHFAIKLTPEIIVKIFVCFLLGL